jgi:phosphoglycerate dehydrogenase-like enzyme
LEIEAKSMHDFRVGLSADFLNERGCLVFPDIGLGLFENIAGLSYEFMTDYRPVYGPDQLAGYDVVISGKPRVAQESLARAQKLTAIGRCGVGYDNVDLAACTDMDIAVYITPAGVTRPMAESIVLLVLALSHNLVSKDRLVRRGQWMDASHRLGREPRGRIIGTIGFGNIAREAVRLLKLFNPARILACDPQVTPQQGSEHGIEIVSMSELLRMSDYVLINCPLNESTRGLIGETELRAMKPDAFLVNTARGAIVNEQALIRALEEGWIRGAALDVFEKEPIESSNPLLNMENVILTSHSVGWTEELFRDMGRIDCEGALAIRRGMVPENVVNSAVLSRPGFQRKLCQYKEAWG